MFPEQKMAEKGGAEIISLMQTGLVYAFVGTVASRTVICSSLSALSCRMVGDGSWGILRIRELFLSCLDGVEKQKGNG